MHIPQLAADESAARKNLKGETGGCTSTPDGDGDEVKAMNAEALTTGWCISLEERAASIKLALMLRYCHDGQHGSG